MTCSITRWALAATVIAILVGGSAIRVSAQPVTFEINDIDLGSIDRIGDLNWSHTLGTTWDENFTIGGIVGKKNATVIPEVRDPFFGEAIIPEVKADTRTGARFTGHVSGGTGLEFFADFRASGLSEGSDFDFRPSVEAATGITSGEFFQLSTSTGLLQNAGFDRHDVDLPSFEAGMNFFFDLELRSRVEAAVFPVVPYTATNFNPDPIHVDQSLLKFEFDLDPKSNPDSAAGIPPRFVIFEDTLFESTVEFLDDSASIASKQISVDVAVKDQPGVKRRLDIGEVQLVNPFGVGQSALGGSHPNLTIRTSIDEATVGYSFEMPLLRLGLDLDGIAAFLGTGQSFTRLEEKIGEIATITADLIDIKYGPEIGYRETVEIRPDFDVTLDFDQIVAVRRESGVMLVDSFTGTWGDLPEISLLGEDPVEVTVRFDSLTGELLKKGAMYLTDYLELTLLELESVNILDTVDLSLPPLLQARTSVISALLGEVELNVLNQTQAISPIALSLGAQSFVLQAQASPRVYQLADSGEPTDVAALADWRTLSDHAEPMTLAGKVLVVGQSADPVSHGGALQPIDLVDEGALITLVTPPNPFDPIGSSKTLPDARVTVSVGALEIPAGSSYTQAGARDFQLGRIVNNGLFHGTGYTELRAAGDTLLFTGSGLTRFENTAEITTPVLINGPGHTVLFENPAGMLVYDVTHFGIVTEITRRSHKLNVSELISNAGEFVIDGFNHGADSTEFGFLTNLSSSLSNTATGTFTLQNGATMRLNTPRIVNDGLIDITGAGSKLTVSHGSMSLAPAGTTGMYRAADGGLLHFTGAPVIGQLTFPDTSSSAPALKQQTFLAAEGGRIQFNQAFEQRFDTQSRFETEVGGELVLNGIEFPSLTDISSSEFERFARIASDFLDIVNRGTLTVASGENLLFITPPGSQQPGAPQPTPQPVVTPLNLVNTGEVVIQSGAKFGFEVQIENYTEGGAVFDQGTWTLIGATPDRASFSNLTNPDAASADAAVLDLRVVQVSNEDSYIGTVFFGDGNAIQEFDTRLVTNASNVTLSGQALFPYLNTIEENRGSLALLNRHHFTTVGDLVNTGEIRIEGNSALDVAGNLVVDEGTVVADASSGFFVGTRVVEVIGGSVTVERPAGPISVNTSWVVREKWVGFDENGDDIILEGRVSYGDAHFRQIGFNRHILLDGERAVIEPLAGLERIEIEGSLTLTGGNELRLAQSLTNEGTLKLAKAGKLYVDGNLTSSGQLMIGADTYLDVTGALAATAGSIQLDGVAHVGSLSLSAGTILSAKIADSTSTSQQIGLFVDGQATLGGNLQLMLGSYIPHPADMFTIVSAAGGLAGAFANIAAGQRLDTVDGLGSFLVHYGAGSALDPNQMILTAFELAGDFNRDGSVDAADYVAWRKGLGTTFTPAHYNTWRANFGKTAGSSSLSNATVPEPTSAMLLILGAAIGIRRRGRTLRARHQLVSEMLLQSTGRDWRRCLV